MGLTGSHWVRVPANVAPEMRRYYQQLTRFSSAFALFADVSMLVMGGALKRREKLSARLGDILSLMYLASATLKRYEDEGRQAADAPLAHWAMWDAMFRAQNAFEGVAANFPNRLVATLMRRLVFPLGRPYVVPSDRLGHDVAQLLISPGAVRERLTAGMYVPADTRDAVGVLEAAFAATVAAEPVEARIRAAVKAKTIVAGETTEATARAAVEAKVITAEDAALLARAAKLREDVIRVDDFPQDFGLAEAAARVLNERREPAVRAA